ncbi:MAG: ATP-binding region ATPase domain protein [Pelosinus sp.]|nr:ATP-binding region ATPase domain protein [Pelosinus sp.]
MSYLEMSNLAVVAATIFTAPMYVYLYIVYRERFMGIWVMCWLLLFTRFVLFDYGIINWENSAIGSFSYQAFYIVPAYFLIYGIQNFINQPVKKHWLYGFAIIMTLSVVSTVYQVPLVYQLIPSTSFGAAALIYTGYILLNVKTRCLGKYVTGCSLILWGILTFIIFCLYTYIQDMVLYSIMICICGILRLFITCGILLVYFEKTREGLISNQEALQQVNLELQQANQELNHFCHCVAHDFKAPLQSINKLSQYFMRDYADKVDNNGKELITHIQNKSAEVVNITDHLLELSRMSQKQIAMKEIKLEPLFREVYDELIELQPERQVEFKIKQLPMIHGDPIMIKILVANILSNALKYTRNREKAIIEVASAKDEKNYIISVKDNGAGFDMSESSRLFQIFDRLHSVDQFEGTGVGLVVCQKILKRHNGSAWLKGKVNEGAVFYFSFPKSLLL